MDVEQVRNRYLKYFERQGHVIIPSASLVPENDPTTLFTAAGMQPLVPYLLGAPHPSGTRLVNSQLCFRAEDITEVGDNRHTTFFEMLGNWSLGDYFKREQLQWFFEFLVNDIGLPVDRLYVTVFAGEPSLGLPADTESASVWKALFATKNINAVEIQIGSTQKGSEVGMQGGRIFYYDGSKNWWSRGGAPKSQPVGDPGGPDSEVFFEFTDVPHNPQYGEHCHVNCDCGRFMEIGNSVFMEYVKTPAGSFDRLPKQNVDFGGGLERIAAARLNNPDIFSVDVFAGAIAALEKHTKTSYKDSSEKDRRAYRIILDHLRASVFIATSGVTAGNKERGYLLRRLIRRSLIEASSLGLRDLGWIEMVVLSYIASYENFYTDTSDRKESVLQTIIDEATKFTETLHAGLSRFKKLVGDGALSANDVFDLYQSFGFPVELSVSLAREHNIIVDEVEIAKLFVTHQERSRSGGSARFKGGLVDTSEKSVQYHTATHLLNQALRDMLGPSVYQKGSNITPERLRFDFPANHKLSNEEIARVEATINTKIKEALPVTKVVMPLAEAQAKGVVGVFGERYPDMVSVYRIGTEDTGFYSQEICGGPHVSNTSELKGQFKIVKEEGISQGVRRIKAVLE